MPACSRAVIEVLGGRSAAGSCKPVDGPLDAVDFAAEFFDVGVYQWIGDQRVALYEGVIRSAIVTVAKIDVEAADLHVDIVKRLAQGAGFKWFRKALEKDIAFVRVHRIRMRTAGDVKIEVHIQLARHRCKEIEVCEGVLNAR